MRTTASESGGDWAGETAAGGVVYRFHEGRPEILLIEDRYGRVALAKGHVERGELLEETALREVWEETGMQTRIVTPLARVTYAFSRQGRSIPKQSFYYLQEVVGGELRVQSQEIDDARFLPLEVARTWQRERGYDTNTAVLETACGMLEQEGEGISLLAGAIDHTQLAVTVTRAQIEHACREAVCYGFAAVCVSSRDIGLVARQLSGSACKPCSTIGFPAGSAATPAKAAEASYAISQGAQELDMVISLSDLVDCNDDAVIADVRAVVAAAGDAAVVKAIIETGVLTPEQQERAARLCVQAGAQFVKTSTGFAGSGATPEVVERLRSVVGERVGIKASGGIASRAQALALIAAGANRIGTSKGTQVVRMGSNVADW